MPVYATFGSICPCLYLPANPGSVDYMRYKFLKNPYIYVSSTCLQNFL